MTAASPTLRDKPSAPAIAGRLIRVFPRQTKASPTHDLAYFGPPDLFAEADQVHVSVTFTADKPKAEHLAQEWRHVEPVKVGGVAYGDEGRGFVIPGRYINPGYTFTSRGCPRRCWFCSAWKRCLPATSQAAARRTARTYRR